jgi:hypothetical protein
MIPSDQYGFIVPANDVSALTAALQRAATTHWEPAVIAAWAQSRSWEQVARDVIGRLQEIVAQA